MALTVLVFVGLAVLTFAVVMLLTRPTGAERAVQVRVAAVQRHGQSPVAADSGPQGVSEEPYPESICLARPVCCNE